MSKGNNIVLIALIALLAFTAGTFTGIGIKSIPPKSPESGTETTAPTESVPEASVPQYVPTEDLIDLKIGEMSLTEKVAQMMMVSCHNNVDISDAASFGVGGICFYAFSFEGKDAQEVKDMIAAYQNTAPLPMLVSTDEEGGSVNRVSLNKNLRAVPFWSPSDLFKEGGMDLIISDTEEKADLLLSLGINVNLAPVCDVPESEDNYIYNRCFSTDYDETADYVSNVVSVMEEKKIGSTLKHFPGYGASIDTHQFVSYDYRDFSAFENGDLKPFIAGIEKGADCVMVSHNIVTCLDSSMPSSLSKPVHDLLRDDLGFEGVIMTDDLTMQGITNFTDGETAVVAAVMAGNDMLACEDYRGAAESVIEAVEAGKISEERIDESVRRILLWKAELGILQ